MNAMQQATERVLEEYFGLQPGEGGELLGGLQQVTLAGGDWLFRQDEAGESLYLLVRGRLQIWREDTAGGRPSLLGEVLPGESVGEVGLLTGEARSASARAIRDCVLVHVDRERFEALVRSHPELVLRLASTVARRLHQNTTSSGGRVRQPRVIALRPLEDTPRVQAACDAIIGALGVHGAVAQVSTAELAGFDGAEGVSEGLKHWIAEQEDGHRFLVFRCAPESSTWVEFATRQADLELLVAASDAWSGLRPFERANDNDEDDTQALFRSGHQALVLLQPAEPPIEGTLDWLQPRRVEFHLHLRDGHEGDLARVARVLSGTANGLVLGGGAARGFAHLGVYRAMIELGVPIDWIGGTSIGAIIGAGLAQDVGIEAATENARLAFVEGRPFEDYTIPLVSLLSGDRMVRLSKKFLAGNLEDLPIPLFCISSNIAHARINVHERGPIWRAVAASAALPGVLPPVVHEGDLAVDGAILNNLPVDVMQSKPVGRIFAVELSVRESTPLGYDVLPSAWTILRSRLMPFAQRLDVPGLATLVLKSTEVGTRTRVLELGSRADVLFRPPVREFSMLKVTHFQQIVQAGYDHGREHLAAWLEERGQRERGE